MWGGKQKLAYAHSFSAAFARFQSVTNSFCECADWSRHASCFTPNSGFARSRDPAKIGDDPRSRRDGSMSMPSRSSTVRLFAVVVLYQMTRDDSAAIRSLQEATHYPLLGPLDLEILFYDNTPGEPETGSLPEGMRYEAAGRNMGLAAAYNRALEIAELQKRPWLLLLDQDTALPPYFLESVRTQIKEFEAYESVVALVPKVRSSGVLVSPKSVKFFGLGTLGKTQSGVLHTEITAINSGTVLRCDFVRSIGGFNRSYWLDYLDHWLFRQIYAAGKEVAVSKCEIEHQLSVLNYRQNISITRYRSILAGEAGFMTTHKVKSQLPFYLVRLLVRSARFVIRRQPAMAMVTMATIARIVMHPMRSLEGGSL